MLCLSYDTWVAPIKSTLADMFDIFRVMMITVGVLICLITLTSQLVHSNLITVDITSGNSSPQCCTKEGCMCASLSVALQYINSSTTINITSSSVMLEDSVKLGSNHTSGSGNLTDITITGSNVTIMCNNSGSVYCESCSNVKIEGITWDRCGDPNGTNIAGVTFNGISNISLVNCTFQHSKISAVYFLDASENVNVNHCSFLSISITPFGCTFASVIFCNSSKSSNLTSISLNISDSYFYYNDKGPPCIWFAQIGILHVEGTAVWHVIITKTTFSSNEGTVISFFINGDVSVQLRELDMNNNYCYYDEDLLYFISSIDRYIRTPVQLDTNQLDRAEILITSSRFTNNHNGSVNFLPSTSVIIITFVDVEFSHNMMRSSILVISFFETSTSFYNYEATLNFTRVNVMFNKYGETIDIHFSASNYNRLVIFEECEFFNNTSYQHGAAFYINSNDDNSGIASVTVNIQNSKIHHNHGDTVIYLNNLRIFVNSSNFTDNVGSSIYLINSFLECGSAVIFTNNTADNGGALYTDQATQFDFRYTAYIQFINNSAAEYGGAIYMKLPYGSAASPFLVNSEVTVSFINNTAGISGNSLYFYIPTHCEVETNIRDFNSILYEPCQFNYSQPVNGKMMHIPCDLDYTLLNGTGAPIVTSPHELRLYFPFSDGRHISSTSHHNVYTIRSNVLGYPVKFTGAVFDYFGKPAEPTQFDVQCVNCSSSIVLPKVHFLVDNILSLSISFTGANIKSRVNISVTLTSTVRSVKLIITTLVVELLPCIDHPGYTYSTAHKACVCYHHNVDCHDSYNEIKRGYWFGSVSNTATTATTAPCHHYCKFTGRTETRQGYFELPSTIDGQCNDHRVGRACGECSSGYTLSYDSTDCISVDQCGTGWTVLVITLTCLYWIAVVAGVFGLMYTLYFKFQISLGYLYVLIYYYSIIRILLDNNPNLSNGVFQFASVLSSFAQLTPQFLGELCFVKGLSGIDQLFIHYSHAVGISLLLLLIVTAARWSGRVTSFVSRCIIPVICLLILLSYTSIVSTSLQLLQPLRLTDVKEWYTYSSPNIQYFHGRHAVYGVVAIICELVVGIGLPLLLLLQPFLSRRINFIRIKPLLDQFQGCYKDKYRCFAAYYLICRQVIFAIVLTSNRSYYDTAFYLLAASIIIAGIHMWMQPYRRPLLNGLDGIVLLLMILANSYVYMNNWLTTVLEIIALMLPLIFLLMVFISKGILSCRKKERHHQYRYVNINNDDVDDKVAAEENIIRFVSLTITS